MTMRDAWIDVRERLPEPALKMLGAKWSHHCLVWPDGCDAVYRFTDGEGWETLDGDELPDVTHWQPIEGPGDE